MQYFGGKARIAKQLTKYFNTEVLQPGDTFIDMFCGSCNVVSGIRQDVIRYANDKHYYLMQMWKMLQKSWQPPEYVSEELYAHIRDNKSQYYPALVGFVGFGCSFAGKWWGGYCRGDVDRNYAKNAYNSVMKKISLMQDVKFSNKDFIDFILPWPGPSVVYCDIPYANAAGYQVEFDRELFYNWVDTHKGRNQIFISEYAENVPDGFEVVWEMQSKKDIRNGDGVQLPTTEILMTPK